MYGLKENTDLSFFKDKTLLQVCIGVNEVILNFDGGVAVTCQSDIGHLAPGTAGYVATALYKAARPAAPMLLNFLNSSVTRASAKAPGTLLLEFSNQEAIEIYDSDENYESYQISYDEKVIVV